MNNDMVSSALELCSDAGVVFDCERVVGLLAAHLDLIREWNRFASLVSMGDAEHHLVEHCVDSISLAICIREFLDGGAGEYIDIGTGGGFPAIPLCLLFPDMQVQLVERNTKKTTFLKKVLARLSLSNVSVVNDSFEGGAPSDHRRVITARAIEKPEVVLPRILASLGDSDQFLCQSEAIHEVSAEVAGEYTIELVEDIFSTNGMRRNCLYQISRIGQ
jgi:16S rRNA (guanine(527)-N(7))-methyltransferase RsmG